MQRVTALRKRAQEAISQCGAVSLAPPRLQVGRHVRVLFYCCCRCCIQVFVEEFERVTSQS